jgi:MFS family permease
VAARDLRDICIAVKNEPKGSLRELVTEGANRRALIVACGVLVLQQLCAINTVMYYVPSILEDVLNLQQACAPSDVACRLQADCGIALWSLLPAGANALGTVVGLFCVDRFGRRPLLLVSLLTVTVSLVGFGVVYTFAPPVVSVVLLVVYLLCFSPGLGPVPWALSSEVFAIKIRMMGVSIATACNWLSNGIVSVSFPPLSVAIGLSNTFYMYAAFALGSLAFVFLIVPETKQKTLEQVQTMLKESPYPTKYFGSKRRIRL